MLDTSEIYTSWKLNLTDSSYYLGVAFGKTHTFLKHKADSNI